MMPPITRSQTRTAEPKSGHTCGVKRRFSSLDFEAEIGSDLKRPKLSQTSEPATLEAKDNIDATASVEPASQLQKYAQAALELDNSLDDPMNPNTADSQDSSSKKTNHDLNVDFTKTKNRQVDNFQQASSQVSSLTTKRLSTKRAVDNLEEGEELARPASKKAKIQKNPISAGTSSTKARGQSQLSLTRKQDQGSSKKEAVDSVEPAKTQQEIKPNSLQGLPQELQFDIFQRVLVANGPIQPTIKKNRKVDMQNAKYHDLPRRRKPRRPLNLGPGLLATNKYFRDKGSSILYENQIDFTGSEMGAMTVRRFRRDTGPVNRHQVKHVVIGARIIKPMSGHQTGRNVRVRRKKIENAQKAADLDFSANVHNGEMIAQIAKHFDKLETLEVRTNLLNWKPHLLMSKLPRLPQSFQVLTVMRGPRNHPTEKFLGSYDRAGRMLCHEESVPPESSSQAAHTLV